MDARHAARTRVEWRGDRERTQGAPASRVRLKLLALNDFHGHLSADRKIRGRSVGGAAVLASYLKRAASGMEDRTLIAHAGDMVGASPPDSALLRDEPSIMFLDLLANEHCRYGERMDTACNVVGTLGNHELDRGKDEMLRLVRGGNSPAGPFLEDPWRGASFPYVSANVVDDSTGEPILPPYVIKEIQGVRVAFVGATLTEAATLVPPSAVARLRFLDEADSINRYVPEIVARGVRAIVATIHQGGKQVGGKVEGEIARIVARLDGEVDVVVSGHTHVFTDALVPARDGRPILVTQAYSAGSAYADIDLGIDPRTGDVVEKSAEIVTTWADEGPGRAPDPEVAALVSRADAMVAPVVREIVGRAARNITRTENEAGESALGDLVADAQRKAMNSDFAFMNPGGLRADLRAGSVRRGDLLAIHPFGNRLVRLTLTGAQIYELLEQQWIGQSRPRMLQVSGLAYDWDASRPPGARVLVVRKNGTPIDRAASYTVAANAFLAEGGDRFSALGRGARAAEGPLDVDALAAYIRSLPQPFTASIDQRIRRLH